MGYLRPKVVAMIILTTELSEPKTSNHDHLSGSELYCRSDTAPQPELYLEWMDG